MEFYHFTQGECQRFSQDFRKNFRNIGFRQSEGKQSKISYMRCLFFFIEITAFLTI